MTTVRVAAFFLVATTLVSLVHVYLYRRLVRDVTNRPAIRRSGAILITLLGLSIPTVFFVTRGVRVEVSAPFAWVAYLWMGLMLYLLLMLAAAGLLRTVSRRVRRRRGLHDDADRRLFLSRIGAGGAAIAAGGVSGFAVGQALGGARVVSVRVALERLPPALRGFRIVQLTDLHLGPLIGREFLDRVVRQVNALEPHMVAITGDLVDGTVAQLAGIVESLREIRAQYGVFFVTGNHEYFWNAPEWIEYLPTLGIRVLRNERVAIHHQGAMLDVAGIDDWSAARFAPGHGPDLTRALRSRDPSRRLVLLSHQPKSIDIAERAGVDLQLSGHTHGGQIFPWTLLVRLAQPYLSGLHRHGRAQIYVSKGTGYWGPPMRLGTRSEITLVELA